MNELNLTPQGKDNPVSDLYIIKQIAEKAPLEREDGSHFTVSNSLAQQLLKMSSSIFLKRLFVA